MTPRVPGKFVDTASLWHSGQTSALYSVASTGVLHDPDSVVDECERILRAERTEQADVRRLRALQSWAARFIDPDDEDRDDYPEPEEV